MDPPAPPVLASRYRLDYQVCPTAATQVWYGTDMLLNRPVVIRVLSRAEGDAPERFLAKARLTGAVAHRGITRIYDFGETQPGCAPFLVAEYIDGMSLAEHIADGPMALTVVLDAITQAASALHAAHQAGLRHGAIKPSNILVTRDGAVKLTDFGGTPAAPYYAPELTGGGSVTVPGDLYALGVIARECLTGTRGKTVGTQAFLRRLTSTDPSKRPASAAITATQATRLLSQLRPPPTPGRLHRILLPRTVPRGIAVPHAPAWLASGREAEHRARTA